MLRTILALLWFRDTVRSETQVLAVALATPSSSALTRAGPSVMPGTTTP